MSVRGCVWTWRSAMLSSSVIVQCGAVQTASVVQGEEDRTKNRARARLGGFGEIWGQCVTLSVAKTGKTGWWRWWWWRWGWPISSEAE